MSCTRVIVSCGKPLSIAELQKIWAVPGGLDPSKLGGDNGDRKLLDFGGCLKRVDTFPAAPHCSPVRPMRGKVIASGRSVMLCLSFEMPHRGGVPLAPDGHFVGVIGARSLLPALHERTSAAGAVGRAPGHGRSLSQNRAAP